jgi:hypothetical protein
MARCSTSPPILPPQPGNAARRQNTSKKPLQPPPDWVSALPGAGPHSGQPGVTLYQVSIAQVLGDNGTVLIAAERAAPAEVRYRPSVHRIPKICCDPARGVSLPSLRAFAARTGLPGT